MYCPRCSQQQVSEEIRFCPRCGFRLDEVKSLLDENQSAGDAIEAEPVAASIQTRKKDVLLGATLMLVGAISVVLLMVSTVAGTPLQAVVIPLLLVWVALVSALLLSGHAVREVAKLFSKDRRESQVTDSPGLTTKVSAKARRQALPPAQSTPVAGGGAWRINTAELAQQPRSVTERTTDLLDKN